MFTPAPGSHPGCTLAVITCSVNPTTDIGCTQDTLFMMPDTYLGTECATCTRSHLYSHPPRCTETHISMSWCSPGATASTPTSEQALHSTAQATPQWLQGEGGEMLPATAALLILPDALRQRARHIRRPHGRRRPLPAAGAPAVIAEATAHRALCSTRGCARWR